MEDQAAHRLAGLDLVEGRGELLQDLGGEHVEPVARHVKADPDAAVVVAVDRKRLVGGHRFLRSLAGTAKTGSVSGPARAASEALTRAVCPHHPADRRHAEQGWPDETLS